MLQENCYVVSDETKECMIVDCGAFYPEERQAIVDYIRTNDLKPMHLVATTLIIRNLLLSTCSPS